MKCLEIKRWLLENNSIHNMMEVYNTLEVVARDNELPVDAVIAALELAVAACAHLQYGPCEISASLNKKTYEISLSRSIKVVDSGIEYDYYKEIPIDRAVRIKEDVKVGEVISEILPIMDSSRENNSAISKEFDSNIRALVKENEYEYFSKRIETVMVGTVHRIFSSHSEQTGSNPVQTGMILDIGGYKVLMPESGMVLGETFAVGNRVSVYIETIKKSYEKIQTYVSRASPQFVVALFKRYVKEMEDGVVSVVSVARFAAVRTKIVVRSSDKNIDPVGTCIGERCSRIHSVLNELHAFFPERRGPMEKIDIVRSVNNPGQLIASLVATSDNRVDAKKVILYSSMAKAVVIVPKDQIDMAIGRQGHNVKLARQISKCKIMIVSDEFHEAREKMEFKCRMEFLQRVAECSDILASNLIRLKISSARDIIGADLMEIEQGTGADATQINRIKKAVRDHSKVLHSKISSLISKRELDEDMLKLSWPMLEMVIELCNKDITTAEQVAELDCLKLFELLGEEFIDYEEADIVIREAKALIEPPREEEAKASS